MRSFFRLALLGLILVLVAAVSALTAMRFAIHGREAAVPKLLGLTPAEAQRVAAENGLLLAVENRYFSAEVPAGRIVAQLPPPGTRVRRGWRVRVAESLGAQQHIVPGVVGQSERAAEINIRRRGLDVGSVSSLYVPGAEAGAVIAQSPPASASAASPKVNLLVAGSPPEAEFVMPDFVGRHLAEATVALEEAGLRLGNVQLAAGAPGGMGPSIIVRQSPPAGSKVGPGAVANFEVSH